MKVEELLALISALQLNIQQCPVKMDTASRPWVSRRRPDALLTDGRLSMRWTKRLKCIGPKPLINLATVNPRFPGTLGSLVERQAQCAVHIAYSIPPILPVAVGIASRVRRNRRRGTGDQFRHCCLQDVSCVCFCEVRFYNRHTILSG
jgi:hypothetical protein